MKKVFKIYLLICTSMLLQASVTIDNLLANLEEKSDLSIKTKKENGGVSYIFTRHDLDTMQAKHLRDILKSTTIGYSESRYGLVDPMRVGTVPFLSSAIRIFIDNQEITSALYGSGLASIGDIDLGFVDHIEIYTLNPSFEFTTEPALTIIKLYSKVASRDEGGKISVDTGSYNSKFYSLQYAENLKNFSYYTYVSKDVDNKKNYYINDRKLDRDKKHYSFFSTIYNDKEKFLVNALSSSDGGFIGLSMDGSPQKSKIDTGDLHIGYERKLPNRFNLSLSLDYIKNRSYFKDNPLMYYNNTPIYSFYVNSTGIVYTLKLKHKLKIDNNQIVSGVKYRYKKFIFDKLQMNDIEMPRYGHNRQTISTIFTEDNYNLKENSILSAGISYGYITNNGNVPDQHTTLLRVGHTYIYNRWVFKTFGFHMENATEPYLINSFYVVPNKTLSTQKLNLFLENIKYKKDLNSYEAVLGYFIAKDYLLPNSSGLIDNSKNKLKDTLVSLRWTFKYQPLNSLYTSFDFQQIRNIPQVGIVKYYKGVIRHIHNFAKFNFFEELIYDTDNIDHKNYFDLSAGAKYRFRKNLTISVKGENLLNKAKRDDYSIFDLKTFTMKQPLSISPIDRRVTLSLEWYF